MGDASDMSDIHRFMRSPEGEAKLEAIRQTYLGRTVTVVRFANNIHTVAVELLFDNGATLPCQVPEFDIDTLREDYIELLEREYHKDHPHRGRPT